MATRLYHQIHATWVCDYHIVSCPKYRGKVLAETYIKLELKRMFNGCLAAERQRATLRCNGLNLCPKRNLII